MARAKPTKKTRLPKFSEIDKMSYSSIRSTYSNLRTIFNKRIKRAIKQGIPGVGAYAQGGPMFFPKLNNRFVARGEQGLSVEDMHLALQYDVKELVNLLSEDIYNEPLSISGFKRREREMQSKMISSLHDSGYKNISKTTLSNFGRFMEAMREQYGKKRPPSEEMAEFFNSLKYNTKRKGTRTIIELWEDYVKNGYQPSDANADLFST